MVLTRHLQVPGTIAGEAHLGSSEIEIGMGIHNEAGVQRVSPVPHLNELIQTLLDLLLSQSDPERGFLPIRGSRKDNVILLINNLGGVSELELGGIVLEAVTALSARGVAFDTVPTDQPWLWREAYLKDPDGNLLCLFQAGENRRYPPWRVPPR